MSEAKPSDYDRGLAQALGIEMPADWDDEKEPEVKAPDKFDLKTSVTTDHIVSTLVSPSGAVAYIMKNPSNVMYLEVVDTDGSSHYPTVFFDGSLEWNDPVPPYLDRLASEQAENLLRLESK